MDLGGSVLALGPDLAASISDPRVLQSIAAALIIGAVALAFGTWLARHVAMLGPDAPAGEVIGVGLGLGLLVLTAIYASAWSAGRSAFAPVAISFAVAIALAFRTRRRAKSTDTAEDVVPPRRPLNLPVAAIAGGGVFFLAIGLLYGATMAPSPRDGVQPLEFMDEAYYSILGRDLATGGTESIYLPAGFDDVPGLPPQTWYHWGEIWLAASAISIFGLDAVFARHYVAFPLLLLVVACLTGTLVRRVTLTSSKAAFFLGAIGSLFLAPVPIYETFFGSWPRGMIFSISMYGMAVVSVLLALVVVTDRRALRWSTASTICSGAVIASILPTHIVLAVLAFVGIAGVVALRVAGQLIRRERIVLVPTNLRGVAIATVVIATATAAWGVATGHGIGTTGLAAGIAPFNASWLLSIVLNVAGAGVILSIPVVFLIRVRSKARASEPHLAWLIVGTSGLLAAGAIAWGARLGDFTMFHVFYGALAVFVTPVALIAIWALWHEMIERGRRQFALILVVLIGVQITLGVAFGIARLQQFGPGDYEPVPTAIVATIRSLPGDAKLAYACQPIEEIGFFWDPRLVGIDAHTGHRIVPMCFQAEAFAWANGGTVSRDVISPLFLLAPQRAVYPTSDARPSSAVVTTFLREHGIGYIYADGNHPNTLVPDATVVAQRGDVQLLRVP